MTFDNILEQALDMLRRDSVPLHVKAETQL